MIITPSYIPLWIFLSLLGLATGFYLHKKRRKDYPYLFFYSIFYIYLLFVFRYTQFPIYLQTPDALIMAYDGMFRNNLIFIPSLYEMTSTPGILNTIMFIPFGFGIGFLLKMSIKRTLLLGLSFSFIIELLQFLNMIITRFSLRTVNINDLINNTIGALIGYLLFCAFIKLFKILVNKFDIPLGSLTEYIYKVK